VELQDDLLRVRALRGAAPHVLCCIAHFAFTFARVELCSSCLLEFFPAFWRQKERTIATRDETIGGLQREISSLRQQVTRTPLCLARHPAAEPIADVPI
jgi:hypothetical protein